MQQVLIPASNNNQFKNASEHLNNRSLLFNTEKKSLYIKYNGEMNFLGGHVDNDNILLNDKGEVSLSKDIHCDTLTVAPDDSGLLYKDNVVFGKTTDLKRILLLFKVSDSSKVGTISGKFYEKSSTVTSSIIMSASVNGSRYLNGSTNAKKVEFVKCQLNDNYYLGLKFNPNTTIYFSGYEFIPDDLKISFDYDDSSFKTVSTINNEGTGKKSIIIENENKIVWDFKDNVIGLDSDNKTVPNTDYDLQNGLHVSSNYSGNVYFYPQEILLGDLGYIVLSTKGGALTLSTNKRNPYIKIYFSSNIDSTDERTLYLSDTDNNIVYTGTSSNTQIVTVSGFLERNKNYYIGSTASRIRIYKIELFYDNSKVNQEGHDAYSYVWDFDNEPSWWSEGGTDWENGLVMIRIKGKDYTINTNATAAIEDSEDSNTGYVSCYVPSGGGNIFSLKVPYDNAVVSVCFTTGRNGGNRTISLINADGDTVVSSSNKYTNSISKISATKLKAGNYYLFASAQLNIWQVSLSGDKVDEIIEEDKSQINKVINSIDALKELGEDMDAYNIYVPAATLTLSDLELLASKSRNSDKKISFDLSMCKVADDAKVWSGIFNKCTSLVAIKMPQGVTSIESNTFVGCFFLERIDFSSTIKTFVNDSTNSIFSGTRIRTYVLPKSLKSISVNTFANSGVRNIIVPPDNENSFYSMLSYGSLFNTLDYIRIYMTQDEFDKHDWTLTWEHNNFIGDTVDTMMKDHIIIYSDLDKLLESLNYGGGGSEL